MRNPRLANLAVAGSCVRGRGEHSLTPYNPITPGGLDVGLLGSTRVIVKLKPPSNTGGATSRPGIQIGDCR